MYGGKNLRMSIKETGESSEDETYNDFYQVSKRTRTMATGEVIDLCLLSDDSSDYDADSIATDAFSPRKTMDAITQVSIPTEIKSTQTPNIIRCDSACQTDPEIYECGSCTQDRVNSHLAKLYKQIDMSTQTDESLISNNVNSIQVSSEQYENIPTLINRNNEATCSSPFWVSPTLQDVILVFSTLNCIEKQIANLAKTIQTPEIKHIVNKMMYSGLCNAFRGQMFCLSGYFQTLLSNSSPYPSTYADFFKTLDMQCKDICNDTNGSSFVRLFVDCVYIAKSWNDFVKLLQTRPHQNIKPNGANFTSQSRTSHYGNGPPSNTMQRLTPSNSIQPNSSNGHQGSYLRSQANVVLNTNPNYFEPSAEVSSNIEEFLPTSTQSDLFQ